MSDRHQALGRDLDDLKARVFARLGKEDVQYVRRMNRTSRALEVVGRGLIHFSFEPVTFTAGVIALWLHKQLQATEIGHTALHGAYDKLPGGEDFAQDKFYWHVPIDEESWRRGHNHEHHGNTNVAGRDPDIEFGVVRLTEQTPHRPVHKLQLPLTLLFLFPNFGMLMNLHFTGLDKPKAQRPRDAWRRALRKYGPYYAREYVLFPALAGPFWWKVLLGNWLAETMRDIYSAATIYCGHVGDDVSSWPEGTRPRSRGEWYAMQIQATNDFEVPTPVSVLCGGLDRQIEHHLFPTLPPPRLREIAPEVRAICERHGIEYKTGSWPQQLRKALRHIRQLARDGGARAVMREAA
jgi:fatty acid desaturase